MTYEEAIRRITVHNSIHQRREPRSVYITEALHMAVVALEKQIPKKPINSKMNWAICPNCGGSISKENVREHIVEGETSYCEHCGQALDFNENGSDTE